MSDVHAMPAKLAGQGSIPGESKSAASTSNASSHPQISGFARGILLATSTSLFLSPENCVTSTLNFQEACHESLHLPTAAAARPTSGAVVIVQK